MSVRLVCLSVCHSHGRDAHTRTALSNIASHRPGRDAIPQRERVIWGSEPLVRIVNLQTEAEPLHMHVVERFSACNGYSLHVSMNLETSYPTAASPTPKQHVRCNDAARRQLTLEHVVYTCVRLSARLARGSMYAGQYLNTPSFTRNPWNRRKAGTRTCGECTTCIKIRL